MRRPAHVAIAFLVSACGAPQGPVDSPQPRPHPPPEQAHALAHLESGIFIVFSGTDARDMAALGERLEKERPPLAAGLLDRMLAHLGSSHAHDPEVRMMRAMLFRTTAVVVGSSAQPTLANCAATNKDLASLCADALREIEDGK